MSKCLSGIESNEHTFEVQSLLQHVEGMWGTGTALLLILVRRHWRRMAFPLVLLITVAVIHSIHRPYWYYYYLHFALPLACLTGYAAEELSTLALNNASGKLWGSRALITGRVLAASLLIATVGAYSVMRLWDEVDYIKQLLKVKDDALVTKMKEYASRTKWVYTRETIYPFYAGLLVIPELAVLPAKRFWSGQITANRILAIVKEYQPEQILLGHDPPSEEAKELLEKDYTLVFDDDTHCLYVKKALAKSITADSPRAKR